MTAVPSLPLRVKKDIRDLHNYFWEMWKDLIECYPDTQHGQDLCLTICRNALLSIVLNYVEAFGEEYRQEELEILIEDLRDIQDYRTDNS